MLHSCITNIVVGCKDKTAIGEIVNGDNVPAYVIAKQLVYGCASAAFYHTHEY